jgi:prepilin-type N-terminal cleavage/methylation domain-containing protein
VRASFGPFRRAVVARPSRRRGFTIIELLNTLSIVAILSALAMYGVGRYVRHAKTLEALGSVHAMGQAAVSYFNDSDATQPAGGAEAAVHAMRHFPPSSRASVPKDRDDVRGKRYQSTHADWSPSPWRELNFSIPTPQFYRYSFESSGTGKASTASALAEGELDGSGAESSYRQRVMVNDKFEAELVPNIERENVDE